MGRLRRCGGYVSRHGIEQVSRRASTLYAPLGTLDGHGSVQLRHWRARRNTKKRKQRYRQRASMIEGVNACVRNRGLRAFNVRGIEKGRAVAPWPARAHDEDRVLGKPALAAI